MSVDKNLTQGVFDLRAVLAERAYPEDTVEFYVQEEIGYAARKLQGILAELNNQLAVAQNVQDKELIKEIGKQIATAKAKLEELKESTEPYVATVRSISRRAKQDIQSQGLHRFPFKRDLYGRDEVENELARNNEISILLWANSIVSLEAPSGAVQLIDNDEDIVRGILETLPESAYKTINAKVDELLDDGDLFDYKAQDPDFS